MICSAIGEAVEDDNRPFAHVTIEDLEFVGLLDSGALVSLHRNSERVRTAIKEVTIDHEISRWYAAPSNGENSTHLLVQGVKSLIADTPLSKYYWNHYTRWNP